MEFIYDPMLKADWAIDDVELPLSDLTAAKLAEAREAGAEVIRYAKPAHLAIGRILGHGMPAPV